MNFKNQAIQKCGQLIESTEKGIKKVYHLVVDNQRVQNSVNKMKDFYQQNKTLCIGVGVAILAYFLFIRKPNKNNIQQPKQPSSKDKPTKAHEQQPQKQQKKKSQIVPPATNKKFVVDDDVQFFPDEPSTDIINKQGNGRRKGKKQVISSQQSQEDRIFFQMYHTYRKTQADQ